MLSDQRLGAVEWRTGATQFVYRPAPHNAADERRGLLESVLGLSVVVATTEPVPAGG